MNHAKVVLDDRGEPYRMIGTAWESNESRSARDALSRALRYMSDGFLSADEDWRITFVNLEAEDVLGSSEEELFGDLAFLRKLWSTHERSSSSPPPSGERVDTARISPESLTIY